MNQNRSLTIVGVFVSAFAIFLALQNQKPETKSIKTQTTTPLVTTAKPRSVAPRKVEVEPSNQFTVETRVSMADPNQTN